MLCFKMLQRSLYGDELPTPVCEKELQDIFAKLDADASQSISQELHNEVELLLRSTSTDPCSPKAADIVSLSYQCYECCEYVIFYCAYQN